MSQGMDEFRPAGEASSARAPARRHPRGAVRAATAALVAVLAAVSSPAHAQRAADKAAAEQLFKEARALMSAERYDEACPMLEASLRLDAALGTRLNLAACYEQLGKLASAWGMYHEAEDLAAKEQQPKRVKFARDRAKALEPRLPRLIVVVPSAVRVAGLLVTRDGTPLDPALYGTAIYVDPGQRTISASAPGHLPLTREVNAVEGEEVTLELEALEAEPAPPPAPPPLPQSAPAPSPERVELPPLVDGGRPRRLLGLGVAAVGVVGLGTGLGFGAWAKTTWEDAKADGKCDLVTNQCTPAGQRLAEDARTRATISTVAVGAGAALVVAGVVVYLTAPAPHRATVRVSAALAGESAGVVVTGAF